MPLSAGTHGNQGKALVGSSTVAQLTGWTCDLDLGIAVYNAVSGGPWQRAVRGNKKASGTIKGKYDVNAPIDSVLNTDSIISLVLYHNASQRWISLTVLIGKISYTVEVDGQPGSVQEWAATFESDGAVVLI